MEIKEGISIYKGDSNGQWEIWICGCLYMICVSKDEALRIAKGLRPHNEEGYYM